MLIMGWTGVAQDFELLPVSLALAGFRVLLLDNRGMGRSSVPATISMRDMAGDAAAVMEASSLQGPFHVMGELGAAARNSQDSALAGQTHNMHT